MQALAYRLARRSWVFLALAIVAGCAEVETTTAPDPPVEALMADEAEEEIFGSVYINGVPITSSNYYVTLRDRTTNALIGPPIWVNPAGYGYGWMYGWFDSGASDGPCADPENPGEVHQTGLEETRLGVDLEQHCITPGHEYVFRLYNGHPSGGTLLKSVELDYPFWQGLANGAEMVELANGLQYQDIYMGVDLAPGTGTDTPVLWMNNGGPTLDAADADFENYDGLLTGTTEDYFRFSFAGTASTSAISGKMARPMAKIWVFNQAGNTVYETGYYTFYGEHRLQRTLRFSDIGQPAGTYVVAIDIMRPDEAPRTTPHSNAQRRTIVVTNPPVVPEPPTACFSAENFSTWRLTPQRLDATCSTNEGSGATYSWRWTVNSTATAWSAWTAASSTPRFDFAGHMYAGTQRVELKVATPNGVDTYVRSFTVTNSTVTLSGPSVICQKAGYTYTSNISGDWLERWPPDTSWDERWSGSSYYRIWSAGTYDVVIRVEGAGSPLRRRELLVHVNTGSDDCLSPLPS